MNLRVNDDSTGTDEVVLVEVPKSNVSVIGARRGPAGTPVYPRRRGRKASHRSIGEARACARCVSLRDVLGEVEAVVLEVKPWDVHGVGYVDVTVAYADRTTETARLGPESVPEDLRAGEHVVVSKAVNMIVAIRRP